MTPQQFSRLLKANQEAVKHLISRVLPVKAGRMAKGHFSEIYKKQPLMICITSGGGSGLPCDSGPQIHHKHTNNF